MIEFPVGNFYGCFVSVCDVLVSVDERNVRRKKFRQEKELIDIKVMAGGGVISIRAPRIPRPPAKGR